MSLAASHPHSHPTALRTWLLRGLALLGAPAMLSYGALAIDAGIHYATMPRLNGITLSVHNVLAGVTMLFGALHVFGGGMTLLFAALMAAALRRQAWGWAREWSWFLLACLLATPSLWWALPAVGSLGLPTEYVQAGHAWRLAAYGQWMPLIGAFLCAIHSDATHAKLAR